MGMMAVAFGVLWSTVPSGAGASTIVARPVPGGSDPLCETFSASPVVWVAAQLGGDAVASGIAAADFRIRGLEAYSTTFVPNPAASLVLPVAGGGFFVAFSSCQAGPAVALGTISIIGYAGEALELHVEGSGISAQCPTSPRLHGCQAPEHAVICVPPTTTCVNNPACCPIGLSSTTWGRAKLLFK